MGELGKPEGFAARIERRIWHSPPTWGFHLVVWFVGFLERLIDWCIPPPQRAMQKAMYFVDSHVIFLCVKLGLAEAVGTEGAPLLALSKLLDVQPEALTRLIRAAAQIGFFAVTTDGHGEQHVKNTKLSYTLHESHYAKLKPLFEIHGEETLPAFLNFEHALKTCHDAGAPSALAKYFGAEMWDFFAQNPGRQARFSRAMQAVDALGARILAEDHCWAGHGRILDVGGASGSFLAEILTRGNAHSTAGVVCDLPAVVATTRKTWAADASLQKLLPRVDFAEVDFFKQGTIPLASDGDCYLMRQILHDWSDADSTTILANIRTAIGNKAATLAIIEMSPIDERRDALCNAQRKADLSMMCVLKGKERDRRQWAALLGATGFELERVLCTRSPFRIMLSRPVARDA